MTIKIIVKRRKVLFLSTAVTMIAATLIATRVYVAHQVSCDPADDYRCYASSFAGIYWVTPAPGFKGQSYRLIMSSPRSERVEAPPIKKHSGSNWRVSWIHGSSVYPIGKLALVTRSPASTPLRADAVKMSHDPQLQSTRAALRFRDLRGEWITIPQ